MTVSNNASLKPTPHRDRLIRNSRPFPANLYHRLESRGTYIEANSTPDALILIYYMYHPFVPNDALNRALPHAYKATLALFGKDIKRD
jgi:hypothetical protein